MHSSVRSALVVLLLGAVAAPLAAQDIRPISRGPERAGFWWGFGLGAASTKVECDGCVTIDKETFPTLDLRFGGTLSPRLRLGVEVTGGAKKDAFWQDPAITENVGNVNVSAYFYPGASGNFWLQGGLAGVVYSAKDNNNKLDAVASGLILGLGYDLRFGRNGSITPSLRFVGGGKSDLKDQNNAVVLSGWKTSYAQVGVAVMFH
ncbi:MAG: hypothetical protein ABJB33_10030 [Gemmatimonadota bacterium]